MCTILTNKYVVARKEHRCDLCGWDIAKGDKHRYYTAKDDTVYSMREHLACVNEATRTNSYDEWGLDDRGEYVHNLQCMYIIGLILREWAKPEERPTSLEWTRIGPHNEEAKWGDYLVSVVSNRVVLVSSRGIQLGNWYGDQAKADTPVAWALLEMGAKHAQGK